MTFNQYAQNCLPLLYHVAKKSFNLARHDAEDIIQETLLQMWKRWDTVDQSRLNDNYTIQLFSWRAGDFLRRQKRKTQTFQDANEENNLDLITDDKRTPSFEEKEIINQALRAAKKQLKPRDLSIFLDWYLYKKPVAETAKRFKIKESTVHVSRCRTKRKIRNIALTLEHEQ